MRCGAGDPPASFHLSWSFFLQAGRGAIHRARPSILCALCWLCVKTPSEVQTELWIFSCARNLNRDYGAGIAFFEKGIRQFQQNAFNSRLSL